MSEYTTSHLQSYRCGARASWARSAGVLTLGAGALALAADKAEATILVFTPTSGNTVAAPSDDSANHLYFSLTTGQVSANSFSGYTNYFTQLYDSGADHVYNYLTHVATVAGAGHSQMTLLAKGATIDGSLNFPQWGYLSLRNANIFPAWSNTAGYIGLVFSEEDGNHYGWAKLAVNSDSSLITLVQFAGDTVANEAIVAGAGTIPEPASSAALLAAGAAGLALYRHRKNLRRAA